MIVARTTALARVAQPTEDGWWLDKLVEPLQELISEFREAGDWEMTDNGRRGYLRRRKIFSSKKGSNWWIGKELVLWEGGDEV